MEDECHFLIDCAEYEDLREEMFRVVDEKMLRDERAKEVRKEEEGKQRLMNALIGHGVADKSAAVALRVCVCVSVCMCVCGFVSECV